LIIYANPSFLDTLKGSGQTLKQAGHPIKLNKNASVYVADIRDKESVLHIAKREEIDTCIHLDAKIRETFQIPSETLKRR
jgi:UDP-glucose 4-epimerase